MNKILLLLFVISVQFCAAQQSTNDCNGTLSALPSLPKYKKFTLTHKSCIADKMMAIAYYTYGSHDEAQVITIRLTDGNYPANEGTIGDVKSKYELIKTAKPAPSARISAIKLGTFGFEAYDAREGINRTYGYMVILKNRYIFEFGVNNVDIHNLNDLRDFISDYLSKINLAALK